MCLYVYICVGMYSQVYLHVYDLKYLYLWAEGYDTKSNIKLSRFQSQLQVFYVSSHTEEL